MEFESLIRQVMENPLILRKLISHLKTKELLPLRLVNHFWKSIIDIEIPSRIKYIIETRNEAWVSKMTEDLKIVKSLKISSILFWWGYEHENLPSTIKNNFTIAFHLRELGIGPQIDTLEILIFNLKTEADIICLETLINLMPNLKSLKIRLDEICPQLLQKYGGKFLPKVKMRMDDVYNEFEDAEQIVSGVFKIFPNLETNFDNVSLDLAFYTSLIRKKEPFPELKKVRIQYFYEDWEEIFKVFGELDQKILPNLKALEISISIDIRDYGNLEKFLTKTNFPLLERIKLLYAPPFGDGDNIDNVLCLNIPPLRKLKELVFEIPEIKNGKPVCLLNLGKQLANDFPSLEKLTLRYPDDTEPDDDYNYPECWGIWEPFLPISDNDNDNDKGSDLSPFKAIRHVDFALPLHWFEQKENLVWATKILQVYNKLYARVSKKHSKDIEKLRVFCNQEMSE